MVCFFTVLQRRDSLVLPENFSLTSPKTNEWDNILASWHKINVGRSMRFASNIAYWMLHIFFNMNYSNVNGIRLSHQLTDLFYALWWFLQWFLFRFLYVSFERKHQPKNSNAHGSNISTIPLITEYDNMISAFRLRYLPVSFSSLPVHTYFEHPN